MAVVSFVCSVGNIPLASLLWSGGISFGGVVSFIYADLIIIPLVLIYRKYYGNRPAVYLTLVFLLSMIGAGIIVDLIFSALGLIPHGPRPASAMMDAHFAWDYTTWLDLVALVFGGAMIRLHLRHSPGDKPAVRGPLEDAHRHPQQAADAGESIP